MSAHWRNCTSISTTCSPPRSASRSSADPSLPQDRSEVDHALHQHLGTSAAIALRGHRRRVRACLPGSCRPARRQHREKPAAHRSAVVHAKSGERLQCHRGARCQRGTDECRQRCGGCERSQAASRALESTARRDLYGEMACAVGRYPHHGGQLHLSRRSLKVTFVNEPLVIARAFHLASTLLLTGAIMFRCFVAAPAFRAKAGGALEDGLNIRLALIMWAALAVAMLSGAAWLLFVAAEIGGLSVADAVSEGLTGIVLTQTAFGDTWMLRLAMASLLAVLLLLPIPNPGFESATDLICAMLAAGLAASLAWAGHAAATEGFDGTIHLASDGLHLVAAGAWLGALWPLSILLGRARLAGDTAAAAIAYQATLRFSVLGMISVAAILTSGVVNTYEILGMMAFSMMGTDYNRLLLAKIALFIAMLALAAFNRQRLTPRLSNARDHRRAIRQLQWNSLAEVGLGLLILAIVAVLGRMAPHAHG